MARGKKKTNTSASSSSGSLPATVGTVRKTKGNKKNKASVSAAPVSIGYSVGLPRPVFKTTVSGDGRIRVRHREYIRDILLGDYASDPLTLPINPGMSSTFPWLCGIAQLYESYVFNSLHFEYMPTCGTATAGAFVFAIDYDANDPKPQNKSQLMQMHGAVRTSVWNAVCLQADSQDLRKLPQRYTRKTVWGGNGDLKTYDVGNLVFAVSGYQGDPFQVGGGELYVSYDVELMTPQPWINSAYKDSAKIVGAGTVTLTKPFGSAGAPVAGSDIVTYDGTTGTITFRELGQFLLTLQVPCTNPLVGSYNMGEDANVSVWELTSPTAPAGTNALYQQFTAEVHQLGATLRPIIQGGAVTAPLAGGIMRFAPYLVSMN